MLTNPHSIPVIVYSDFLYNVLSIISLTNNYIPVTAYSNFSHSVLPIILLINPYSILPVVVYSKFIDKLTLLTKYLFNN